VVLLTEPSRHAPELRERVLAAYLFGLRQAGCRRTGANGERLLAVFPCCDTPPTTWSDSKCSAMKEYCMGRTGDRTFIEASLDRLVHIQTSCIAHCRKIVDHYVAEMATKTRRGSSFFTVTRRKRSLGLHHGEQYEVSRLEKNNRPLGLASACLGWFATADARVRRFALRCSHGSWSAS